MQQALMIVVNVTPPPLSLVMPVLRIVNVVIVNERDNTNGPSTLRRKGR
jgi:hypothetical protein